MRNSKTKTGGLIGCGSPDVTTLEQANANRKALGLPPFDQEKFDKILSEVPERVERPEDREKYFYHGDLEKGDKE